MLNKIKMKETTMPKKFCFVLMPFDNQFDDIYSLGIKQSCIDAGAYCERVDEQIFNEPILERIYNQISKADIIIADMTDRNPNVFYEVGYAHALGKTTILLTQKAEDIPFDLKHFPHIIYNNKIVKLKDDLTQRVKWCLDNVSKSNKETTIDIDIFLKSENLSSKVVEYKASKGEIPNPTLTIHNKTFRTYDSQDYRIGVITDKNYYNLRNPEARTTNLPDGRLLHMLPFDEDKLYPNSYSSVHILLNSDIEYKEKQEIIVRLFTPIGTRDYPLIIEK